MSTKPANVMSLRRRNTCEEDSQIDPDESHNMLMAEIDQLIEDQELIEQQTLKFDIVELDDSDIDDRLFNFLINDEDPLNLNVSDVEALEEDSDAEESIEKISDIHGEIIEIEDSDVEQEAISDSQRVKLDVKPVKLENKHTIKQETGEFDILLPSNDRTFTSCYKLVCNRNCQGVSGFD